MSTDSHRPLGLADLILFNVAAVLGVQWIAASAHIGPFALPLHAAAALLFFLPCARVVAALARRFPDDDGFPAWVTRAFGDWHGFLCAWSYWISVLVYLPGLLMAGAGMAAYAVGPRLADDARFVIPLTLAVLWSIVGVNIAGLRISKWLNDAGGLLIYAAGLVVVTASVCVWWQSGSATALQLTATRDWESVSLWAQIAFAYTGLELGSVLGREVRAPKRTIPRAAWISATAVFAAYVFGTVSLMVVLPPERIHPMTGIVGVAAAAGERTGAEWLGGTVAALLFAGIAGRFSTWAGGVSRVPIGIGTPNKTLFVEAVACSAFVLITQQGETLRAGWQTLTDLAILTTFLPFVYIFVCGWRYGARVSSASGLLVTVAAILLSVVPPASVASVWLFELKVIGGCALLAALGRIAYNRVASRPHSRPVSESSHSDARQYLP
ncbi:MAG TPA: APC family permease [Bryobacteraceae bacterium]|nr:APC family permease [Bryobacteraceae bacterium]